jgi:hypothetical protein
MDFINNVDSSNSVDASNSMYASNSVDSIATVWMPATAWMHSNFSVCVMCQLLKIVFFALSTIDLSKYIQSLLAYFLSSMYEFLHNQEPKSLGRWVAKLVAGLLVTAVLRVQFQTSLKNTKWDTS